VGSPARLDYKISVPRLPRWKDAGAEDVEIVDYH
jgi:hypothetical protein